VKERREDELSIRLKERIRREGAISFHDWMQAALYDERDGYYRRTGMNPWGRAGDYRTSPERSPLLAQTLARFFAKVYEELEKPARWTLWESGAGAGHLAQGVLESLKRSYPQIFSATRYVLDEASPAARAQAQQRLAPFGSSVEYLNLSARTAPFDVGIIFANELLDAFPVHRVTMSCGNLRELFVTTNDAGEFVWMDVEPSTPRLSEYLERLNVKLAEGQLAEISLHAEQWLRLAAASFKRGYLILIDYGAEATELYDVGLRPKGSLRAFRQHSLSEDVLQEPGRQDITTTFDWTNVMKVCREMGLEIVSFERQDRFLMRAGLLEELARMTEGDVSVAASLSLSTTAREMILPGGMSQSFQVLSARK
jgi:SAM-dependent MidA family methyltransferase